MTKNGTDEKNRSKTSEQDETKLKASDTTVDTNPPVENKGQGKKDQSDEKSVGKTEGEGKTASSVPTEDAEELADTEQGPDVARNKREHDEDAEAGRFDDTPEVDPQTDNDREIVTRFDREELDKRQDNSQQVVPGRTAEDSPTVGNPNGVDPAHNSKKNDPYGIDGDGHVKNAAEVHDQLKADSDKK